MHPLGRSNARRMETDPPPSNAAPPMGGLHRSPPPAAPYSYEHEYSNARPHRIAPPRRSWLGRILRVLIVIALIPVVLVPLYIVVPPVSTLMIWRWVTFQRVERHWVPLSRISPDLIRAVIGGEDARFCTHRGVDWRELLSVIEDADDLGDLSFSRGASTIPMQTAKNLFLWPGRQYVRKVIEIPLALYMDLVWSKPRMLEIYLNIAEWGPSGEFGVEAGARRAFNKSADELSSQEAYLLAGALPNPILYNPGRPGPRLRAAATKRSARAQSLGSRGDCVLQGR